MIIIEFEDLPSIFIFILQLGTLYNGEQNNNEKNLNEFLNEIF